jgi:lipopolysaccharide export system permease protein
MARPTVRILSRYLLRQHLGPLGFALAALTTLMLLNQVAKQFGNLVGKGLSAAVITEVFVLSIPFIVAVTLPMAVLVAVLHAFTRLAGDNEITALQAGGVGVRNLLGPVLGGAVAVAVLSLLWSDQLLPRANHRLRTLLTDIQRTKPTFTLKEQVINEVVRDQFFLSAARIDQASNRLKDVTIYDLQDPERRRIIAADSGRMAFTPERTDLYLTLMDGEIREVRHGQPGEFNRTFFRTNRIRVSNVQNIFDRTQEDDFRGDRELSICDMERKVVEARLGVEQARYEARATMLGDLRRLAGLKPLPATFAGDSTRPRGRAGGLYCAVVAGISGPLTPEPASAQAPVSAAAQPPLPPPPVASAPGGQSPAVQRPKRPATRPVEPYPTAQWRTPRTVTLAGGNGLSELQRVRVARQRVAMYEVEIQKKYAIAAACIVFAILGVPIALRFPRGGTGLVFGTSVVVFAVYYVGLIGGEELGDRLVLSPFFAMWGPNLIFAALGVIGLLIVERAGVNPRGGGGGGGGGGRIGGRGAGAAGAAPPGVAGGASA